MAAIELAPGADDNGLAIMMATMMSQNLDDHPDRVTAFERLVGRVAIVAEDADVALTMEFRTMKLRQDPECPLCGENPTVTELIDYDQFCGTPPITEELEALMAEAAAAGDD